MSFISPVAASIPYQSPATGSVATSLNARANASVLLTDFMTPQQVADSVSQTWAIDCSAAVQAAVNYCIANNRDLEVPYIVRLSASVNINRQVDGAAFDRYFRITSRSGGGFAVSTAIPMFTSSIPFTTAPVSQLVSWEDIAFVSTNSALAAYVLDNAKFLRVKFVGCDFQKIKLLSAPTVLTQSIYVYDCNIRRVVGTFFSSLLATFDFKFRGNLFEASDTGFTLAFPVGCSFMHNTPEGFSTVTIRYYGAQAFTVHGNYFEGSLLDLDGTNFGGETNYGVSLISNYFSNLVGAYPVKWGLTDNYSCHAMGNYGSDKLHQLAANSTPMIFDASIGTKTSIAGYSRYSADTFSIGVQAALTTMHLHQTANPTIVLTDATLGASYGGAFRGYGVAGQGGRAEVGSFSAGVYTASMVVDENAFALFKKRLYPPATTLVTQNAAALFACTGVPNNADGSNGDFALRSDGGAGTSIYQKVAGAWVARA